MTGMVRNPEGCVRLRLHHRDGRVRRVEVRSDRPRVAEMLFAGRPVDRVLQSIPLLYSVCAVAQGSAAVAACEQALGMPPAPRQRTARTLLVNLESLREHLLRITVDWPALLGEAAGAEAAEVHALFRGFTADLYPENDAFQPGGGSLAPHGDHLRARVDAVGDILERVVFAMSPTRWEELETPPALVRWSGRGATVAARLLHRVMADGLAALGRCTVAPLPALDPAALHRRFHLDTTFTAAPTWEGEPRDTGPLTRQWHQPLVAEVSRLHGNGLLARLVARLSEVAFLYRQVRVGIEVLNGRSIFAAGFPERWSKGEGVGLAEVETARGRLVHRVELRGSQIQRYQILAPTEWNFHPAGVVGAGLLGVTVDEEMERRVSMLINSVDPCVGWTLEVQSDA